MPITQNCTRLLFFLQSQHDTSVHHQMTDGQGLCIHTLNNDSAANKQQIKATHNNTAASPSERAGGSSLAGENSIK